jgi:hypothetical protein
MLCLACGKTCFVSGNIVFITGLSDAIFNRQTGMFVVLRATFVYTTDTLFHTRILLVMSKDFGVMLCNE